MTKEEINKNILSLIDEKNITVPELSQILGITKETIWNNKSNLSFTLKHLNKLKKHFNEIIPILQKLDEIKAQNDLIIGIINESQTSGW